MLRYRNRIRLTDGLETVSLHEHLLLQQRRTLPGLQVRVKHIAAGLNGDVTGPAIPAHRDRYLVAVISAATQSTGRDEAG